MILETRESKIEAAMAKYPYTPDMEELSGFGSEMPSYEEGCRYVLYAALSFLDENPGLEEPAFLSYRNVFGVIQPENGAAKQMIAEILKGAEEKFGQGPTGAMMHASVAAALFVRKNGWEAFREKKVEQKKKREEEENLRPSQIPFESPPLLGCFGKAESEVTAMAAILALAKNGDTWRPFRWSEVAAIVLPILDADKNTLSSEELKIRSMVLCPVVRPEMGLLLHGGYVKAVPGGDGDSFEFTEQGLWKIKAWASQILKIKAGASQRIAEAKS